MIIIIIIYNISNKCNKGKKCSPNSLFQSVAWLYREGIWEWTPPPIFCFHVLILMHVISTAKDYALIL